MQEVELKPCPFCGKKIDIKKMSMTQVKIGIQHLVTQTVAVALLTFVANADWSFVLAHTIGKNL